MPIISGQEPNGISSTPAQSNNTGRDWGEALGIGASILATLLSFGAAAPAVGVTVGAARHR